MGGFDFGRAREAMGVHAAAAVGDLARETGLLVVEKWDLDQTEWAQRRLGLSPAADVTAKMFDRLKLKPYDVAVCPGNLLTEAGWAELLGGGFYGGGATLFTTGIGRIGVGTYVAGAPAAGDTALGSVSSMTGNNWILCGAVPTITTSGSPCTAVWTASFGTTAAVGTWNEWAIDHGTSSTGPTVTATAVMINHAVPGYSGQPGYPGPGTKGAATWTATATLSFT
jgi:hypothetical protein